MSIVTLSWNKMKNNSSQDSSRLQFKFFHIVAMMFVFCFVISNVLSVKLAHIGFFLVPAGIVVFPLSYIFSDILTEVYGFQRARQLVWTAIGCNILFVLCAYLAIALPAAPGWAQQQQAFKIVFGIEPRVLLASSTAYFVGDFINCTVLAKLKLVSRHRWMGFRFIGSTAAGIAADNLIFCFVAFAGLLPITQILWVAAGQYVLKVSYEALMLPASLSISRWLKKRERTDIYDFDTEFSPWKTKVNYTDKHNCYQSVDALEREFN